MLLLSLSLRLQPSDRAYGWQFGFLSEVRVIVVGPEEDNVFQKEHGPTQHYQRAEPCRNSRVPRHGVKRKLAVGSLWCGDFVMFLSDPAGHNRHTKQVCCGAKWVDFERRKELCG